MLASVPRAHQVAVHLVIDATEIGNPVAKMFEEERVRPVRVTFSGGQRVFGTSHYEVTVPKRDLLAGLGVLLDGKRLKIGRDMGLAQALVTELKLFRVKVNMLTRHESFEADGTTHDDLTCALAIAI